MLQDLSTLEVENGPFVVEMRYGGRILKTKLSSSPLIIRKVGREGRIDAKTFLRAETPA